jgi:hypothetical protein
MNPWKRRRLSLEAIQELVRLACPRDWVEVAQAGDSRRLETLITLPGVHDRSVLVTVGMRSTVVSWVTTLGDVRARSGRVCNDVSLDALNLIRCAVGWLVGENLPPWPDLSVDWEWDDPDTGVPLESPTRPVERFRGDCPS